ncbi:MAG: DNA polymerase III subunit delta [Clostridia bacterium]|nr:DNA polymerase III subunit delta [Clostridia bacterium]
MTVTELKAKLKCADFDKWLILAGEEDYLKRHYRGAIKKSVLEDDAFDMFNHSVFDGADMDIASFRDALYAPPMMSDKKLVEWRHADLDKMKESDKDALIKLAERREDYPYAVVVITSLADGFDTGTEKKPSKLFKKLSDSFDITVFEKSTDAQLLSWMKKHFDAEGISVDAPTLNALLFRVGHSMQVLHEEISKLSAYAKATGRTSINPTDVAEVCSTTVECDAFAISNAIIEKNVEKAFLALTDMKQQRIEPYVILSQLAKTYGELLSISLLIDEGRDADDIAEIMKFHPYRLKLYMSAAKKIGTKRLSESLAELVRIDASSKAGGITGYKTVEMFITKNI